LRLAWIRLQAGNLGKVLKTLEKHMN